MSTVETDGRADRLITTAAEVLQSQPYESTTLHTIASVAGVRTQDLIAVYPSMRAIGIEILSQEGASMRQAQQMARDMTKDPLARLITAFRLVGENLANQAIVRAGVRIAAESSHCFPERNINPFRTWDRFVTSALHEAADAGLLREGIEITDAAWLLVAAGIGTKDLLAFTREWQHAPHRLERTARLVISTISAGGSDPSPTHQQR